MKSIMCIILLSFAVCSCGFVVSKERIETNIKNDFKTIKGVWQGKEDNSIIYVHIGIENNLPVAFIIIHSQEQEVDLLNCQLTTANTEKSRYLSLKIENRCTSASEFDDLQGYVVLKYDFTDIASISLSRLDYEKISNYIKEGKIKGKENPNVETEMSSLKSNYILLTDKSKNLLKFFESDEGNDCFVHFINLHKIK